MASDCVIATAPEQIDRLSSRPSDLTEQNRDQSPRPFKTFSLMVNLDFQRKLQVDVIVVEKFFKPVKLPVGQTPGFDQTRRFTKNLRISTQDAADGCMGSRTVSTGMPEHKCRHCD